MAKPELGLKRQCMSCGAKFYDLAKNPIVCPKCGTVFQASALTRAAPVAARAAASGVAAAAVADDDTEVEGVGPELVSLEEVEAGEAEKDLPIDDDIEVADDVGGDDTFLEEEEEGEDDVSGLIDGDLEDDEEA